MSTGVFSIFFLLSGTAMSLRFIFLTTICCTVSFQLRNWSCPSNCKLYNEVADHRILPIFCNFALLKCGKSASSFSWKLIRLPFLFALGTKAERLKLQSRTVTATFHLFTFLQWIHLLQKENYLPTNPPSKFALPTTFTHHLEQRGAEARSTRHWPPSDDEYRIMNTPQCTQTTTAKSPYSCCVLMNAAFFGNTPLNAVAAISAFLQSHYLMAGEWLCHPRPCLQPPLGKTHC